MGSFPTFSYQGPSSRSVAIFRPPSGCQVAIHPNGANWDALLSYKHCPMWGQLTRAGSRPLISRIKTRLHMIKEDLQRWYTSFCDRLPRMAKFMGLMHRLHRPIRALFMVFAHTLGFFFSIQAVMQTRTGQGAVAWVFALNTVPVVALPAWFVFGTNDVEVDLAHSKSTGSDALAKQPFWFRLGVRLSRMLAPIQ